MAKLRSDQLEDTRAYQVRRDVFVCRLGNNTGEILSQPNGVPELNNNYHLSRLYHILALH